MKNVQNTPYVESGSGSYPKTGMQQLAMRIAAPYLADPRVEGGAVVGSVARGVTDDVSDIDLMLYLREGFSEEEREQEVQRAIASGGNVYWNNEEQFGLWLCADGVKVDLGFNMIPEIEEIIADVTENHSLDNDSHLIVDGIQRSLILGGEKLIGGWKARMNRFPEELARKMVSSNLRLSPLWIARDMCAGRDEEIWFRELLLDYTRKLLWILCGLNRRYYPGKLKGFAHVAATLTIAPQNFLERVEQMLNTPPRQAVPLLDSLVTEVYNLVDREMPEVDTGKVREWFWGEVVCRGRESAI